MEFDKRQRAALIDELKYANVKMERANRVLLQMEEQTSREDQLFQHVEHEVMLFRIKAIEKALIDNNPFDLDWKFAND